MANRERGEQRLDVGAQTYVLRLTIEAICQLEDRSGLSWDVIMAGVQRGRLSESRWLLWAALQDHHAADFESLDAVGLCIDAIGGVWMLRTVLAQFALLNAAASARRPRQSGAVTPPTAASSRWRQFYVQLRAGGMAPDVFWRLSLRELWAELDVVATQRKRDIRLAWAIEYMARQKVLDQQAYDRLAGTDRPLRQTPAEQRAVIEALSVNLNIPLQKIPWRQAS